MDFLIQTYSNDSLDLVNSFPLFLSESLYLTQFTLGRCQNDIPGIGAANAEGDGQPAAAVRACTVARNVDRGVTAVKLRGGNVTIVRSK